jgi:hypothetical protein
MGETDSDRSLVLDGSDRSLHDEVEQTLGFRPPPRHAGATRPAPPSAPLPPGGKAPNSFQRRSLGGGMASVAFKKGDGSAPLPAGPPPSKGHGSVSELAVPGPGSEGVGSGRARAPLRRLSGVVSGVGPRVSRLMHRDLRDASGRYEYAFDDPAAVASAASDTSSPSALFASGPASASAEEARLAERIKGGVQGAGVAALPRVTEPHRCERLFVALLAVSLLWFTSYALARALVRATIVSPTWAATGTANTRAYATAQLLSSEHEACVAFMAGKCSSNYQAARGAELARVGAAKRASAGALLDLGSNVTYLTRVFKTTLDDLNLLRNSRGLNLAAYQLNSTGSDQCQFVSQIVAYDDSSIRAYSDAQAFQNSANAAVLSRQQQILNRQAYNAKYQQDKQAALRSQGAAMAQAASDPSTSIGKVSSSYGKFKGCVVPGGTCDGDPNGGAYARFNNTWGAMGAQMGTLTTQARAFQNNARGFLSQFKSLIQAMRGSTLAAFQQSLGAYTVPPEGEANEPNQLASLQTNLASFVGIDNPDAVFSGTAAQLDAVGSQLEGSRAAESLRHNQLAAASVSFGNGWNAGYNPPPVNTDLAQWNSTSAAFQPALKSKLGALSAASAGAPPPQSAVVDTKGVNLTRQESTVADLKQHADWDLYSYGGDTANSVDAGLAQMSDVIVYFDYAFRAIHTVMVVRSYWRLSELGTPSGDARVKVSAGKGWGQQQTPTQKMVALATNPLVLSALLVTTVSVVLYLVWYLYSPLYLEYVNSCLRASPADIAAGNASGTMLYRNGYSILHQFSAGHGDKLANELVDQLNAGRNADCAQNNFDDTVLYNQQVDQFNNYTQNLTGSTVQNAALLTCLDLAKIQRDFPATATFAASRVLTLASDPNYRHAHPKPDMAGVYNCSAVGAGCPPIRTSNDENQACPGPNKARLQGEVFNAACTSEWWVHANLFSAFMVTSTYVLLNISRLLFMRAVVRCFWRHLVSGPFSFLASCTDRGEIIYPERVTEKGDSMRVAIHEALKLRLKTWTRWGYLLLLVSIVLNVPWVWGLIFLSKNLVFSP